MKYRARINLLLCLALLSTLAPPPRAPAHGGQVGPAQLGMPGHLIARSGDGAIYSHIHAAERAPPDPSAAAMRYDPDIRSPTRSSSWGATSFGASFGALVRSSLCRCWSTSSLDVARAKRLAGCTSKEPEFINATV